MNRHEEDINSRISVLKAMHTIMINMNNEDAYWCWVTNGVPDEPSEEDYRDIAEDPEMFNDCTNHFTSVYNSFISDGFVGSF
jgi:hypothetical protein